MLNHPLRKTVVAAILAVVLFFPAYVLAGEVTINFDFPTSSPQEIEGGTTVQVSDATNIGSFNDPITDLDTRDMVFDTDVPVEPAEQPEAPPEAEAEAEMEEETEAEVDEEAEAEEAEEEAPAETKQAAFNASAGVGFSYSKHVKTYKVPISYSFTKKFKAGVTIPYVMKSLEGEFTGVELEDDGLGDVSAEVKYITTREKFRLVSALYVKFPTGNNKQFEDGEERLALGTGSYDWLWSESIVVRSDRFRRIRYLGGLSYRYNGPSDYSERATIGGVTGNFHFRDEAGDSVAGYAGLVYFSPIRRLMAYCNVSAMYIWPSKEEYRDDDGIVSVKHTLDDSLVACDIVPGIKFQFSKRSAVRLGASIPVYTRFDPDVVDEEDREITVDFGVDYVF